MMKALTAVLIVTLMFAYGCAQVQEKEKAIQEESEQVKNDAIALAPTAARGDAVAVFYTGKLQNGTVFDTNVGGAPLEFTVGAGQMIAGFDKGVVGMKAGQEKTITIPAKDAYGEWSDKNVISIPLAEIGGSKELTVGIMLVDRNGASGKVINITNSTATVDFNHELAGKTLVFTVKMDKITKGS